MESATSNNGPKPLEHHFHANQIRDKKRGEFSIESLLLSKGNQSLKGKCVEFNMCSSKAKNIGLCSVSLYDRTTVKWNLLEELCCRMKNCTGSFSVFFYFPGRTFAEGSRILEGQQHCNTLVLVYLIWETGDLNYLVLHFVELCFQLLPTKYLH